MNRAFHVRAEAERDLGEIRDWYNNKEAGLGFEFLQAVEEVFDRIRTDPMLFEQVLGTIRRAMIRRFSYVAYYRVQMDRVEILGIFHTRRDPRLWTSWISDN